jgi:hypothetical protein
MKAFVSLPFNPEFDGTYRTIERSAAENNLTAYRVDQQTFATSINYSIEKAIKECVVFISDITGNNPNVLHEIGQAQTLGKPMILISRDSPSSAPFNIRNLQIKTYSKDDLHSLGLLLHKAFSETNSPNETLRSMLVPESLRPSAPHKFVIGVSPLSYRRAMGRTARYSRLRNTSSDYVGLRGILQAFGLLYGFDALPEIADPEDCMEDVIRERMTLYTIASPKSNRWTAALLKEFSQNWVPKIEFRAEPMSMDLRNISVSIYKDNTLLCPDGWALNYDMDRQNKDFGVIIRGQNPYHENEMLTIIAGRSSLGTEAASRAFTVPAKIDEIRKRLLGLGANLEDHKQAFWVLVSMKRLMDERGEPDPNSLKVEQVDIFHPV